MANTAAIAAGYLSDDINREESEMQQGLEDLVSWIKELPSGSARRTTATTIASGAFAPTASFCTHTINGEGNVADDLVTITATGIRDGSWIGIMCNHVITIKNSGNITTIDGNDMVVSSTTQEVYLRWDSTLAKWRVITNPTDTIRINKMPGGLPSTALTISAGGVATAIRGFHTITSNAGVTDDLDFIDQTTLTQDTSLLIIKATAGHTINVRHNQSGTGKIMTADGTNLSLTGNRALLLSKNGTQWDVIAKLGAWVANIGEGGTNNGSLGVVANGIYVGNGSAMTQLTGTALQQFRVNAAGNGIEAFSGVGSIIKRKAADTARNTTTTLTDDPDLLFSVAASEVWDFEVFLIATCGNNTPDLKFTMAGPAGSTITFAGVQYDTAGAISAIAATAGGGTAVVQLGTNASWIRISGTITNGATPGNLSVQWAQNTSNGTDSVLKAGSYLSSTKR